MGDYFDLAFLEAAVMSLKILFFKVIINRSAATDFPSLYVEYISKFLIFKNLLKRLLPNSPP